MPVRPGDLITSALINDLLDRIAVLEGQASSGALTEVPMLFGHTLGESKQILSAIPSGFVIAGARDVFGATIDPASAAVNPRLVVGQSPSAGTRAANGTALFVLLAGTGGGGGTTSAAPTVSGHTPAEQRIGLNVVIAGANLVAGSGATTVRFDGTPASIVAQTSGALTVRVPDGIPGAPTTASARKSGVLVQVANANGNASFTMDILGRQAGQPQIDGVAPSNLVLDPQNPAGASFVISGANLLGAAGGGPGTVVFEASPANPLPATGSAGSLTVTLPANWPLAPAQGSSQSFQFRVRTGTGDGTLLSNLATITVATPSIIL